MTPDFMFNVATIMAFGVVTFAIILVAIALHSKKEAKVLNNE